VTTVDPNRGPWRVGWPQTDEPFVALIDADTSRFPEAEALLGRAQGIHILDGRPTIPEADAVADLIVDHGGVRLLSIGSGVAIDTGKLAVHRVWERVGEATEHFAVPCGPEVYRAITPFSMYEGKPGTREAVWQDWLRPAQIALIPELLSRIDVETVQLFAGDSLVHAVESILSRLNSPASEPLAIAAARTFADAAQLPTPDRVELAIASLNAARAFDTTKLGLAHALSRPLGIAAGTSHDAFNLILGAPVVSFWGTSVIAASPLRRILAIEPTAPAWSGLIDGYRQRAGLPDALSSTEITREDVGSVLAWAPQSSGIPNLPVPLSDGDLERVMSGVWHGSAAASRSST
jgi:hypothetical protein